MYSKPLCTGNNNNHSGKPGWDLFVEVAHAEAGQGFKAWAVSIQNLGILLDI